jgi:hypothetical protein
MSHRLCLALVVGLLATACASETRTVVVPADTCTSYGYTPGTEAYRICAEREAAARQRGRMAASYGDMQILADAQNACASYGLIRASTSYENCVQREVTLRRPA